MSWSIGFDTRWKRDIGYGVPATCDHPGCGAKIDRGLAYVCCGSARYGGSGCGLYFCECHRHGEDGKCERCMAEDIPFDPTPDTPEWINHKLTRDYEKFKAERDAAIRERDSLAVDLKSAKAEAYSWEACVRARESKDNKSPCGHHMNQAYSPDGAGKVIRCYICERDKAIRERDEAIAEGRRLESVVNRGGTKLDECETERDAAIRERDRGDEALRMICILAGNFDPSDGEGTSPQEVVECVGTLKSERDDLASQVAKLTEERNDVLQRRYIAEDQVKSLAIQVGALLKDKARLDWLEESNHADLLHCGAEDGHYIESFEMETMPNVRAAIDAALDTAASGEGKAP